MSLRVWLPLTGDLHNQGLSPTTSTSGTPSWRAAGKMAGQALNLSSRVVFSTPELNGVQFFSIAFWAVIEANADSTADWMDVLSLTDKSSGGTTGYFRFETGYSTSSRSGIHWHDNATNAIIDGSYTYNTGDQLGKWHNICLVVSNNDVKSYYDGQLVNTKTTNLNKGSLTGAWWIGEGTTRGGIQDVRIYDHCLSNKEVEEIAKGLVLHYKLNNKTLGNENILTNSTGWAGTANWSGLVTVGNENGSPYLIAKRTDTTSTSRTFCNHSAVTSYVSSWGANTKFTISGWYKIPSSETQEVTGNLFLRWIYTTTESTYADTGFSTSLSDARDVWIRFEKTFSVPANYVNGTVNFYISAFSKGLATIYWRNVKMEKGEIATEWSPAKADTIYQENLENIIYDSSGFNNNGEIVGTLSLTSDSPRYKNAVVFANGAYIRKTDMLFTNSYWTISCWFKKTSFVTSAYETMLGLTKSTGADANKKFSLYIYNNKIGCVGEKTSNANIVTFDTSLWHHACLVNNNGSFTYYMDGTSIKTFSNSNCQTDCTDFVVGGRAAAEDATSIGTPWGGYLSDVKLFTTALSVNQVKELYRNSMLVNSGVQVPRSLE